VGTGRRGADQGERPDRKWLVRGTEVRKDVGVDRKATHDEVARHAGELRRFVADHGYAGTRLRSDGALIVHDDSVRYRRANRLAGAASQVVGA
jgi:hypothetical protein